MGDWWYYTSSMTFQQIASTIKRPDEIAERSSLKMWIQRELEPKRQDQIVAYLANQPQRFFGAIIAGIYGGDPEWLPVSVGESAGMAGQPLEDRTRESFGIIRLRGDESIFPLDGQHRVEAIKAALKTSGGEALATEEVSVIFVGHEVSEDGRKRTRRLFSTLNRYAKPVSKAEIVVLSEDDHFACVTRKLIEEYPGLAVDFVPITKEANIGSDDKRSLLNVIGLYNVVKAICIPPGTRKQRHWEHGPLNQDDMQRFEQQAREFWDAMKARVPAIADVMGSKPDADIASKYRTETGGHLLLRPFGLVTFAKAVGAVIAGGGTVKQAVQKLSRVPFELSSPPWAGLVWDPARQTIVPKKAPLVRDIMLHLAGCSLRRSVKDIEAEYKGITGRKL